MTINPRFGARDYAQRCPVCGWMDPKPPAWEEGFSRAHHCPFDGTPLETLACAECGAPAFTTEAYTLAGPMTVVGRHCPECGGAVTRREPKMITHWKPKNAPTITKLGPDGRPESIAAEARRKSGPNNDRKWADLFGDRPITHDLLKAAIGGDLKDEEETMREKDKYAELLDDAKDKDKTTRRTEKNAMFAAAYGSERKADLACADCAGVSTYAGRDLRTCCGQARCLPCHELHVENACPEQP